jgi:hypothetical protein
MTILSYPEEELGTFDIELTLDELEELRHAG